MNPINLAAVLSLVLANLAGDGAVKLRNEKVEVTECRLKPAEARKFEGRYPALTVYFDDASLEFTAQNGNRESVKVRRGDVVFAAAAAGEFRNTGTSEVKFVRTEFLTDGDNATWGAAGLSPHYKMLVENRYTRTYDIKIPAGGREPQHTHRARVVICLSGATLKHVMPNGREEPSTLKTGEVAWRLGSTHIGQNLGTTDLWVIAVEPK